LHTADNLACIPSDRFDVSRRLSLEQSSRSTLLSGKAAAASAILPHLLLQIEYFFRLPLPPLQPDFQAGRSLRKTRLSSTRLPSRAPYSAEATVFSLLGLNFFSDCPEKLQKFIARSLF